MIGLWTWQSALFGVVMRIICRSRLLGHCSHFDPGPLLGPLAYLDALKTWNGLRTKRDPGCVPD
jgi:hypothetical protein